MDAAPPTGLPARIASLIARVQKLRPVRVFTRYSEERGPILAAGLSYQGLFATFAGIWVGFAVAGLFIQSTPALSDALFDVLGSSLPGLIDDGSGNGAVDRNDLFETDILRSTGLIALAGLVITALNWFASGRDSVRAMFLVGPLRANLFVLKARDLVLALGFALALLVSAVLSVLSTAALSFTFEVLGADERSLGAILVARGIGLALVLALDTVVLALFFRIVSGVAIPPRRLLGGSLLGASALGVLKALGSSLLGGATSNPLLASFAVIIGLLIWFNLVCQVILLAAAWIAVGMADRGLVADPRVEAERVAAARAEEDRIRATVLAEIAAAPPKRGWMSRLLRRGR